MGKQPSLLEIIDIGNGVRDHMFRAGSPLTTVSGNEGAVLEQVDGKQTIVRALAAPGLACLEGKLF